MVSVGEVEEGFGLGVDGVDGDGGVVAGGELREGDGEAVVFGAECGLEIGAGDVGGDEDGSAAVDGVADLYRAAAGVGIIWPSR